MFARGECVVIFIIIIVAVAVLLLLLLRLLEGELDWKNHVLMQDRRTSGIARLERN